MTIYSSFPPFSFSDQDFISTLRKTNIPPHERACVSKEAGCAMYDGQYI
jgi:hypothetical protein